MRVLAITILVSNKRTAPRSHISASGALHRTLYCHSWHPPTSNQFPYLSKLSWENESKHEVGHFWVTNGKTGFVFHE